MQIKENKQNIKNQKKLEKELNKTIINKQTPDITQTIKQVKKYNKRIQMWKYKETVYLR